MLSHSKLDNHYNRFSTVLSIRTIILPKSAIFIEFLII